MQRANKFRFNIAWLVLLTSGLAENKVERWSGPIHHRLSTKAQNNAGQATKAIPWTLLSRSCFVFGVEIEMISITANQFFKLLQNVDMEAGIVCQAAIVSTTMWCSVMAIVSNGGLTCGSNSKQQAFIKKHFIPISLIIYMISQKNGTKRYYVLELQEWIPKTDCHTTKYKLLLIRQAI